VTSPSRSSRCAAPLALAALLLAGCAVGRPTGFTARSNSFCADGTRSIAALKQPTDPLMQMQYATDRYTAVEHTVSELTDSNLPGGSIGAQLRSGWLRPARASLVAGRVTLEQLRTAVNAGDPAAATTAFIRAEAIGTQGVDTSLLSARGLSDCVHLFTPGNAA
jgi:hypothetical protein